jgi:CubicO group peptidase (beta-lactamase class C family)
MKIRTRDRARNYTVLLRLGSLVGVLATSLAQSAPVKSVPLPITKPGQLAADWLKLCRTPNLAQMTKWVTANISDEVARRIPPKDRVTDFNDCAANGGFRVVGVTQSEPNAISLALVGLKSDLWFEKRVVLNDAGKVDRSGLRLTFPAESAVPKDLSDATIASEVKKTVAKLSRIGVFSGIVTVARGTQTIASASGGYANLARRTLITGTSQFTLGSMGKMFTAASIGQLVDQSRMSFDDTVGKFFTNYPNQTVRDKVTVGMLLSHTSGMGDFLDRRTSEMMKSGVKRAVEFMPLYDRDEPQFEPGTNWAYSNAGLALAGAIVEEVSGEDYPEYIRKHIFAVAGMTNSDPNNIPHATAKLVTPYTKETQLGRSIDWHEAKHDIGSPAGGAISTADDLVRFADALSSGKLVSKATFEAMVKPHGSIRPGVQYGYAMEIQETYGRTIVGHGGAFPGVSTHLYLLLDSPYTVVVLANEDWPAAEYAASKIVAMMAEKAKLGN